MAMIYIVESESTGIHKMFTEDSLVTFQGSIAYGAKKCKDPLREAKANAAKLSRKFKGIFYVFMADTQSPARNAINNFYGYEKTLIAVEGYNEKRKTTNPSRILSHTNLTNLTSHTNSESH